MTPHQMVDPLAHVPMHPLEFQVLLVLLEGELHGYGIAKAIEDKETGLGRIYPTNLYRRLRDMAQTGLVAERKAAAGDGNRGTRFEITPMGHRVAVAEAQRLESAVLDARRHKLLAQRVGD